MGMSDWGYSILQGAPSESFTTSGAEAVVRYIGPSSNRVQFIRDVFGAWNIFATNAGTVEVPRYVYCAQMYPVASPYGYPTVVGAGGSCINEYCLWPDTFTGGPSDEASIPTQYDCPNHTNDLMNPIFDTCAWEYTVNYRYRNHARLPRILQQDARVGPNPPIPFGTFTDVRMTNSHEWLSTAGRHWKYEPDAYGTDVAWDFCAECKNKQAATKITADGKAEVEQATEINNVDIEVIWDNVPLPPWDIIRRANGCVNEHPIFGYPRGSVKFEFGEPEITGYFGCLEVYRLRYIFRVKTTQATWRSDSVFDINYNDGEVINGMVGVWNRRWCPCPLKLGSTSFFTHWVPLIGITDETTTACVGGSNQLKTRPFQSFPLHMLFAMNVCDCTSTQVNNGSCTETLKTLAVDRVKAADGSKWTFPDMAEPTALAYAAAGIGTVL